MRTRFGYDLIVPTDPNGVWATTVNRDPDGKVTFAEVTWMAGSQNEKALPITTIPDIRTTERNADKGTWNITSKDTQTPNGPITLHSEMTWVPATATSTGSGVPSVAGAAIGAVAGGLVLGPVGFLFGALLGWFGGSAVGATQR